MFYTQIRASKTLGDALYYMERAFLKAGLFFGHGTTNAWDEAVLLAIYALKLPPNASSDCLRRRLTRLDQIRLYRLASQRIRHRIPAAYLGGKMWFGGLLFQISPQVIVPRSPFAELIQDSFRVCLPFAPVRQVLDLCTGSGCMAILLAKIQPTWFVDAVDIDPKALRWARRNVRGHDCHNVNLIQSDLFTNLPPKRYDLIMTNPPYASSQEYRDLPPEYHWEPKHSLEAAGDGLDIALRILRQAPTWLTEEGALVMEVGYSAQRLQDLLPQVPFHWLPLRQGGSGIFYLSASELRHYHELFCQV